MVCRNVHVARPSCSTSAGQSARLSNEEAATAVPSAANVPPAAAGLPVFVRDFAALSLVQLRKALHGLHGFPSGPKMTPGGDGLGELSVVILVFEPVEWKMSASRHESATAGTTTTLFGAASQ